MNSSSPAQLLIIHENFTHDKALFSILSHFFKLKVSAAIQADTIVYPKEKLAILFVALKEETNRDCLVSK